MKVSFLAMDTCEDELSGYAGIRILSNIMKQLGHQTQILFFHVWEHNQYSHMILDRISEFCRGSDLIGISCMSFYSSIAKQVIVHLKQLNVPIIWGGTHATISTDLCLEVADYVCVGEGEKCVEFLSEFMQHHIPIESVPNLCYKKDGEIIRNPVAAPMELDDIPLQDLDPSNHFILFRDRIEPSKKYYDGHHEAICYHSSRGCPNRCSYCWNTVLHKVYKDHVIKLRGYSPHRIIEELTLIKERFHDSEYIFFSDDDFMKRFSNQDLTIWSDLYKEKIGLPFKCMVSPNSFTIDKFHKMIDSGLFMFELGVQSGSDRINKDIYNRFISTDKILEISELIKPYDKQIQFKFDFITNNPLETEEDILQTINIAQNIKCDYEAYIYHLQVSPDMPLYSRLWNNEVHVPKPTKVKGFWNDKDNLLKDSCKYRYLCFILTLMRGYVNETQIGKISREILNKLISDRNLARYRDPIIQRKIIESYYSKVNPRDSTSWMGATSWVERLSEGINFE